jgi:hypothetical protein
MKSLAFGQAKFSRTSIPESLQDLSTWPTVDITALSAHDQEVFKARSEAIALFVEDTHLSLKEIHRRTGIRSSVLYRLLERCCNKHADGRIYGFRGAVPYLHLKQYERLQKLPSTPENSGLSGAFNQLLQRYPSVETALKSILRKRNKKNGGRHEGRRAFAKIHKDFLDACRAAGIGAHEYPFTQKLLGSRSLSTYIKKRLDRDFEAAAAAAGADKTKRAMSEQSATAPAATKAFEAVEFDGHKVNLRLTVRIRDPLGMETLLEMNRIWILPVIDIVTRVIIGYGLGLGKEYNKDDVANALQNALAPFQPREYKIPGLKIRPGGGFPSSVLPSTQYACWDWFRFDGARCHIAHDTLERLTQVVGCWTDNGPAAEPDERPFVERFFLTLAKNLSHRLPGTTGSDPWAIERVLNDPDGDISLLLELEELEELIEVVVADYNGEPHGGLGWRTPLEALQFHMQTEGGFLRTLPSAARANLCLLQEARTVFIRGDLHAGVRPHVNFSNVAYTNAALANSPGLIGKPLRIYYDVRDIRVMKAFFEDGSEAGRLIAAKPWCFTPHSLRVRQEIFRLKRERKLTFSDDDDPVDAWYAYKRDKAKSSKRAAGELAKHQHTLAAAAAIPPVPTQPDTQNPAKPVAPSPAPASSTPPQPKPLGIKRTLTF